jgi:hypothetical protein
VWFSYQIEKYVRAEAPAANATLFYVRSGGISIPRNPAAAI